MLGKKSKKNGRKKTGCHKDSPFCIVVGVQGFEPWTPWSQTRCATGLRYTPRAKTITLEYFLVNPLRH